MDSEPLMVNMYQDMTHNRSEILHGWWSPSQYALGGSAIYRTPDGRQIEVTQVTPGVEHESGWDDMEYLGPVIKFVRTSSYGRLPSSLQLHYFDPMAWKDY